METNEPIRYYTSGEVLWLKQTFFSIDMILSVHFKGIYLTLVILQVDYIAKWNRLFFFPLSSKTIVL